MLVKREVLVCAGLTAVVLAVYGQVGQHAFINYDDPDYVTANPYVRAGITNPFGWKALDTKALAMGVLRLDWFDTNKERLAELIPGLGVQDESQVHRADYDAFYQARILVGLLDRPKA